MIIHLARTILAVGLALALNLAATAQPQAGLPQRVLRSPSGMRSLSFSGNSAMLAGGNDLGDVIVWDVRTWRVLWTIREPSTVQGAVFVTVAFSPVGGMLAVGILTEGRALELRGALTGNLLRAFPTGQGVEAIAFSPDGRLLVTGTADGRILVWDVRTGVLRRMVGGEKAYTFGATLAFSPDGRLLAQSGVPGDGINLWDVKSGRLERHLVGHHPVDAFAYSPDGRVIAGWARYRNGTIYPVIEVVTLWDPRNRGEYGQVPAMAPTRSLAFAPDGRILAVTERQDRGSGDRVRFWDVHAGRWIATISVPQDPTGYQELSALSFSPDGHLLAGAVFKSVLLWDVGSLLHR